MNLSKEQIQALIAIVNDIQIKGSDAEFIIGLRKTLEEGLKEEKTI